MLDIDEEEDARQLLQVQRIRALTKEQLIADLKLIKNELEMRCWHELRELRKLETLFK